VGKRGVFEGHRLSVVIDAILERRLRFTWKEEDKMYRFCVSSFFHCVF